MKIFSIVIPPRMCIIALFIVFPYILLGSWNSSHMGELLFACVESGDVSELGLSKGWLNRSNSMTQLK